MTQSKSECRRRLLALRSAIPESVRRAASETIVARVRALACVSQACTILGYRAMGSEVRPETFFRNGLPSGVVLLMPSAVRSRAVDNPTWVPISDGVAEAVDAIGLAFPVVVIVPGVAFAECGTRLGRGGGFYDRALERLRAVGSVTAVGLAYEPQIVEALPTDEWDQPVDIIVSEQRVLTPGVASGGVRDTR
jgi:5-formyltetrahydrofolate cyclo-ligase